YLFHTTGILLKYLKILKRLEKPSESCPTWHCNYCCIRYITYLLVNKSNRAGYPCRFQYFP
ncbi:MAG: hypothetical protein KAH15_03115, partial [Candidatus Marinimicrobia bacterium]|nr:hypothetical protein [Candidatus Neomarinimicrobiota bacterium]